MYKVLVSMLWINFGFVSMYVTSFRKIVKSLLDLVGQDTNMHGHVFFRNCGVIIMLSSNSELTSRQLSLTKAVNGHCQLEMVGHSCLTIIRGLLSQMCDGTGWSLRLDICNLVYCKHHCCHTHVLLQVTVMLWIDTSTCSRKRWRRMIFGISLHRYSTVMRLDSL